MTRFCRYCGAPRSEDAGFCQQCGRPFPPGTADQSELGPERPCLRVIDGPANLPFIDLAGGAVTLGRESSNRLVLTDPNISRRHAVVFYEHGQWMVQDLNSRNGTFVNDVAITCQALRHGDRIRLGDALLTFRGSQPIPRPVDAPPPKAPSRRARPQPPAAQAPPAAPRQRRQWGRWLAGLLVVVLLCAAGSLAVSWWLEQPPGPRPQPTAVATQSLSLTPLVSQTLQPSGEPQTVSAQDRVSVTVPGALLTGPETLIISTLDDPPSNYSELFEAGAIYDISLGQQHEFDQLITVEFKYDAGRLSSEMPAGAQVRLATWDPWTGTWTLLPTTVDEARQVAIAHLDHLSAIGTRYLNKVGFRHFDPRYERNDPFPHFRIIYDSRVQVLMELPERRPGTFEYQNRMVKVRTVPDYAMYVAAEAERAYQIYQQAGFFPNDSPEKKIEKIDIIVGDWRSIWGKQADDETHPFGGAIFIRHDHGKLADLRHVVAHELFHVAQLDHATFGAYSGDRVFWFVEASAEFAACRVAWEDIPAGSGVTKPICVMGEGINAHFLRQSLEHRVTGDSSNQDNNHLYHASHFLDYLIQGQDGVGEPRFGKATARFKGLWNQMMLYLNNNRQIDAVEVLRRWGGRFEFDEAYQAFAAYFLFNTHSPMPTDPQKTHMVPSAALGDQTQGLRTADAGVTSNPIKLPARYTAAVWEVVVDVDPADALRQVVVEAASALPSYVYLNVYLSGTGDQRTDYGTWGGPKPVCRLPSSAGCALSLSQSPSLLSIVAVNTGDQEASVTVRVSASTEQPTVQPPTTGARCFCDDGTALVCDPVLEKQQDGFVVQVTGWQMSGREWCYRGCLEKCGCDPDDSDLSCAHTCICGP